MAPLTTNDFDGVTTPAILQAEIANRVLTGAPFSRSLNPLPAASGSVVWPVAGPTGGGWVAEGAPLKEVVINDSSYKVIARKLSGIFDLTSELLDDSRLDLRSVLGDTVGDSLGPLLDDGIIRGAVADETSPIGVWHIATAVPDAPLWEGVWSAVGSIGDIGGAATTVALRPSTWALEASRLDDQGRPLYPNGMVTVGALSFIQCPSLSYNEALIYDSNRVRLVVRRDFAVQFDASAGFATDTVKCRIIGRFAVAVPVLSKSIRKLTITGLTPPLEEPEEEEPEAPAEGETPEQQPAKAKAAA